MIQHSTYNTHNINCSVASRCACCFALLSVPSQPALMQLHMSLVSAAGVNAVGLMNPEMQVHDGRLTQLSLLVILALVG